MSSGGPPRDERGGLGPPPIQFRVGREQLPQFHLSKWLAIVVVAVVLFIAASIFKSIYADYLWFDSLGYASVFRTEIATKVALFFIGAFVLLGFIGLNLWLAGRFSPVGLEESFIAEVEPATLHRLVRIALVAGSIFLAVIFGSVASGEWDVVLRFLKGASFGVSDPAFHRDASFYMFTLPALRFLQGWLVGAVILTLLAVVGVYAFVLSLQNFEVHLSRRLKAHVASLLVSLLLLFAFGYVLSIFDLNLSKNGVVQGASYTDIHARVPGYFVLIAVTVLACGGIVWSVFRRGYLPAAIAGGVWLIALIFLLGLYPGSVQRFSVDPNELSTEQPYIQRNIDMTRKAFGLDSVDSQEFKAETILAPATVQQNQDTINNLRLWDPRYTLPTYRQQQEIRQLYIFNDVDVDRYNLDGAYTEVTLGARELSQANLQANQRGWFNIHFQFTHGFGAVMNPVNKTDADGLPAYNLQNIPPSGQPAVTQPRIYFGELTNDWVIVDAKSSEFDYQTVTEESAQTRYDANRGIKIDSLFRKLIFAWDMSDYNLLITPQITGDSRLMLRRNITQRVQHIAPFLTLDHDPYLVIADGKLMWIQDAYTTSSNFPYSEANNGVNNIAPGVNYIRNSVKVVSDAYTGDLTFYVSDPTDPVIQTYRKIFPSLLKPLDQMPASLRSHLRYPEDLFTVQADVYRTYHMTDPRVFYNKEDLWATPREGAGGTSANVVPYYVIMRLPGASTEEFVLIRPFTPSNKPNAVAWMGARSDGADYGKLSVYRFPSNVLTPGPAQVESSIDAQPEISQRFSLLNVQGSHIIRGNLLLMPLGDSYLYVEPVYLQADQNPKPAVVAVILYADGKVFMEPSLSQTLAVALGTAPATFSVAFAASGAVQSAARAAATGTPGTQRTPAAATSAPAAPPSGAGSGAALPTDVAGLVREAADAESQAQDRLRAGDFAGYGQQQARLRAALDRLNQLVGPAASATPRP